MKYGLKFILDKIISIRPSGQGYVFALLILFVVSCKQPKSPLTEFGTTFESIMLSDAGAFRGFSFGDSIGLIQTKEAGKPVEKDTDYLYYEYPLNSLGSFNIAYNFDERGLNEIHSDIFLTNQKDAEDIFNKFKTYFDQHYGLSQNQMGFSIWSVKSEKYGEVKINLSDESADFTVDKAPGKISVWIYPDKI